MVYRFSGNDNVANIMPTFYDRYEIFMVHNDYHIWAVYFSLIIIIIFFAGGGGAWYGMDKSPRFSLLIQPLLLFIKMSFGFYVCCSNIQAHFRVDFIKEANTMNPDQTAPLGAV